MQDDYPVDDMKSVRVTVSHNVPYAKDNILRVDFIKANMLAGKGAFEATLPGAV